MKRVHFIGIAGIGMSATAVLMKEQGWHVTGSDEAFYPPASDYLLSYHIPIFTGYKKENIPLGVDLFVISRNAKLDPETNKEVKAALETGKPVKSFSEIIGDFAVDTENIVVVGSYGKSTCAALLTWCLRHSGKDPSFFIGAVPIGEKKTAHIGKDSIFIIEGDEYPTSHIDSRPKFAHFHPRDILLTSAQHDHFNIYPTPESYLKPFQQLLTEIPPKGIIVAGLDNPHVNELIAPYKSQSITYGLTDNFEWSAQNIVFGEITKFDLTHNKKKIIELSTLLLGKHNIENIIGISALLLERKLITSDELQQAVASFKGLYRRLDRKNKNSSVLVYEGFGSSYEKARSAIEAIKFHFPDKRLILIFEPHTFSWRNKEAIFWYDDVFRGADKIFLYEPAGQGAQTHKQLSKEEITIRVRQAGFDISPIENSRESLENLKEFLKKDDIILILTSGDLGGMIEKISQITEFNFPL